MTAAAATCLIFVLSLCHAAIASPNHWNYRREDEWPQFCKEGKKQSPIALSPDVADQADFSSLIFEQYDNTYPVQLKNNGHSAEIRLHVESQPNVKGGGLPHIYVLDHLHFHWESEHTMDSFRFPLELHLVHYANRYANLSEALKHNGGVAVFSVLFYLSPENDRHFEPLISIIDNLRDTINTVQQMNFRIDDFLPRDRAGFYRYNGSLTTPPCTEGVIWTVFTHTIPISKEQVKSFQKMKIEGNHHLHTNYRSLQDLNGRRVQLKVSPIVIASGTSANYAIYQKLLIGLIVINLMKYTL